MTGESFESIPRTSCLCGFTCLLARRLGAELSGLSEQGSRAAANLRDARRSVRLELHNMNAVFLGIRK